MYGTHWLYAVPITLHTHSSVRFPRTHPIAPAETQHPMIDWWYSPPQLP